MRYPESKETTVALMRQVISALGHHDAALNPLAFAVFYEHLAGMNPRLSAAFAEAEKAQPRLSDATVRRLHEAYVADVGPHVADRISGDMQRLMNDFAASAAQTGHAAGSFGQQLEGLSGALGGSDTRSLAQHVNAAREGTQQMRQSVQELRQKVAASQAEVEALRADLVRSRQEATLCPLTRVLNRRGFDLRLADMLAQPPAAGNQHCLIMLDIDHFKRVNDTHGHQMGDRVIEGLGAVLRSVPPQPDMACARYGGEEFAILLPSTTVSQAKQVAEDVCNRTRGMRLRNRTTGEVMATITISAGIAAWRRGEAAEQLVACADAALYRSKQNGRDRVTVA